MSRICLSCSLSNHSARPHLVSLIIDWAHLHVIVIQSPQLYISTHFTPVMVRSRTHYVDSTPATILKLSIYLAILTRWSLPSVSSPLPPDCLSPWSVCSWVFPHRICTSYLWTRGDWLLLKIVSTILRSHPLTSSLHCTSQYSPSRSINIQVLLLTSVSGCICYS